MIDHPPNKILKVHEINLDGHYYMKTSYIFSDPKLIHWLYWF